MYDQEIGIYYLQFRYYNPKVGRFLNADSLVSTGQGLLGNNILAYCLNNPVILADHHGDEPEHVIDTDNDGEADCFVYSYKYTTGFWWWKKEHIGYVYIYRGKSTDYFEDKNNIPEFFNSDSHAMVADYSHADNPNMYMYRGDRVKEKCREPILLCLLEYDDDYNTPWNRTLESLKTEWKEHKRYAWASARAQNIDFDNNEEGAEFWYFAKKAWDAFWN